MVISLLILFFGYLTRLVKLSSRATAFTRLWLRTKPDIVIRKVFEATSHRSAPPRASFYWKVQCMIVETIYINLGVHVLGGKMDWFFLLLAMTAYPPLFWHVLTIERFFWLSLALAWGTSKIILQSWLVALPGFPRRQRHFWRTYWLSGNGFQSCYCFNRCLALGRAATVSLFVSFWAPPSYFWILIYVDHVLHETTRFDPSNIPNSAPRKAPERTISCIVSFGFENELSRLRSCCI